MSSNIFIATVLFWELHFKSIFYSKTLKVKSSDILTKVPINNFKSLNLQAVFISKVGTLGSHSLAVQELHTSLHTRSCRHFMQLQCFIHLWEACVNWSLHHMQMDFEVLSAVWNCWPNEDADQGSSYSSHSKELHIRVFLPGEGLDTVKYLT